MLGLAAPVTVVTEIDAEVGVATAEVTSETTGVAVGPTKVAGKLMLKDRAHA